MRRPTRPRRGAATPFILVSIIVFLAAFAMAVNAAWLAHVRSELQTVADSAALAAALALPDDDFLRNNPALVPALIERATLAADQAAARNTVRGRPFAFVPNPTNFLSGDVIFGTVALPRSVDFFPLDSLVGAAPELLTVNTIRVNARQTLTRGDAPPLIFGAFAARGYANIRARGSATIDRGVRGVRPRFFSSNAPLAPLALRSDSSGVNPLSWEHLVELNNGPDVFTFNPTTQTFTAGPDGLAEFAASLATDPSHFPGANVVVIYLGTTGLVGASSQITAGVSKANLSGQNGRFVLPVGGTVDQAGEQNASTGAAAIAAQLEQLRASGQPRIWPLYTAFNGGTNEATVSGFVAARVAAVTPPVIGQPVTFVLQPAVLTSPTVLTDTDLRGSQATLNGNRYVGKVRRVE